MIKSLLVPVLALLLLAFVLHWSLWVWGPSSAGTRITIEHDGRSRSFLLHVPAAVQEDSGPHPLVLVMHGATDFAKRIAEGTGWSRLADEEGFIVAYPEGTWERIPRLSESWNAGHCCMHAFREGVDDVGFLAAVVDRIEADHDVGPVFMAGFSNGGKLAYRVAAEHPERVTAVGAVGSSLWSHPVGGEPYWSPPEPLPPVPVMHIHGPKDSVVPYDGGPSAKDDTWIWSSVNETVAAWASAWGAPTPMETMLAGGISRQAFEVDGREVVVLLTHKEGHSWPGGKVPFFLKDPDPDLDATRALWTFFRSHADQ